MPPTVNARIPLSLLEAVRRMDTPENDETEETEYVQELRNKRFGLSDTVYQQIRRYSDAAKRGQMIPYAEATGLAKLIGRRPDAKDLFDNAGRILATDVYNDISRPRRNTMHALPGFLARRLALGKIRQVATGLFGGTLERNGGFLSVSITDSVTANSGPVTVGCSYYTSALQELLRLLIHGGGSVDHVQCLERGATRCEWRAEWGSSSARTN